MRRVARRESRVLRPILLTLLALAAPLPLLAQERRFPPDTLTNLKVLPADMPVTQVVGLMRNITGWLGVRCQYCHVGEEGMPLAQFDFASDEKRTKETARLMMRMTREINQTHLATIPERPSPHVEATCGTCHRGVPRPFPLIDILTQALAAGGTDSLTRAYRALREEFYGSDAYDFSRETLNTLAVRIARQRRYDDAVTVARLNLEMFPSSADVVAVIGEIHLARGDTAAALVEYRKAMELGGTPLVRQRMRALGQQPRG